MTRASTRFQHSANIILVHDISLGNYKVTKNRYSRPNRNQRLEESEAMDILYNRDLVTIMSKDSRILASNFTLGDVNYS